MTVGLGACLGWEPGHLGDGADCRLLDSQNSTPQSIPNSINSILLESSYHHDIYFHVIFIYHYILLYFYILGQITLKKLLVSTIFW
jgi:hypothetical protein